MPRYHDYEQLEDKLVEGFCGRLRLFGQCKDPKRFGPVGNQFLKLLKVTFDQGLVVGELLFLLLASAGRSRPKQPARLLFVSRVVQALTP